MAPIHYSKSVIYDAAAGARRAVVAAPEDDASAVFKRLAATAVPDTVRFVMGELNLATPPARIETAIARTVGWMLATWAINASVPEGVLQTMVAAAHADALRYLTENQFVRPAGEEGGHA